MSLEEIKSLLAACNLPTADIDQLGEESFELIIEEGSLVAVGAIEIHRPYGFIRSIAVDESSRGKGYAARVIKRLEERARANELEKLFLLTTDAFEYFRKHGFITNDRSTAPQQIRTTNQYSNLCPSSSILMSKDVI